MADAAVIGIPDDKAGEVPRAYIVLKQTPTVLSSKKELLEKDITSFVESKVAQHKRLRGGVVLTDAIPKAASGKILRRVLRDQAKSNTKSKL